MIRQPALAVAIALGAMLLNPISMAFAQLPNTRLLTVHPPGGQVGQSFDVVLSGKDLDEVDTLRFSHPGITAKQKTREPKKGEKGPQPLPNQFTITIAPDVPPGTYEVRAVGRFGTSQPRSLSVTRHAHAMEKEPNDEIANAMPLPRDVAISGRSDRDGDFDFYKLSAKKGERILIECTAQRLDSNLEPILSIHDADGRLLQECRDTFRHDSLLDFTAPSDGDYWVRVCDLTYVGNAEHFYQLRAHQSPHLDFVFPPAAMPGTKAAVRLFGRNLPEGKPSKVMINGQPLEELEVTIDVPNGPIRDGRIDEHQFKRLGVLVTAPSAATDGFTYRLKTKTGESNPLFIGFATAPVSVEKEPNDRPEDSQKIAIPSEVAGQFAPAGDRDWFTFEAKKGQLLQLDVISQRLGVATDPFLVVQQVLPDGKVKDIAEADNHWSTTEARSIDRETRSLGGFAFNTRTDDVVYRLRVPQDGTYRVMVRDLYYTARKEGGALYRLALREARPDFRLAALSHYPEDLFPMNRKRFPWTPLLRRGGTEQIDVLVYRWDGFDGDVELSIEGLPPGVTSSKAVCRKDEMSAPIVLTASDDAKPWDGPIRVVGRSVIDGKETTREADYGTVIWFGQNSHWGCHARGTPELLLCVRDEPAPLRVELGEGKVWKVKPGDKIKIPAKVVRQGEFKGPVQLLATALPSQMTGKATTIAKDKDSGEFEVTVGKNALTGTHHFFLEAKADAPYEKKPALKDDKNRKKPKPVSVRTPSTMVTLIVEEPPKKQQAKK